MAAGRLDHSPSGPAAQLSIFERVNRPDSNQEHGRQRGDGGLRMLREKNPYLDIAP
jgi:hypothetical protein